MEVQSSIGNRFNAAGRGIANARRSIGKEFNGLIERETPKAEISQAGSILRDAVSADVPQIAEGAKKAAEVVKDVSEAGHGLTEAASDSMSAVDRVKALLGKPEATTATTAAGGLVALGAAISMAAKIKNNYKALQKKSNTANNGDAASDDKVKGIGLEAGIMGLSANMIGAAQAGMKVMSKFNPITAAISGAVNGAAHNYNANVKARETEDKKNTASDTSMAVQAGLSGALTAGASFGVVAGVSALGVTGATGAALTVVATLGTPIAAGWMIGQAVKSVADYARSRNSNAPEPDAQG